MKLIDILRELNVPKPEDSYVLSKPVKRTEQDAEGTLVRYTYRFNNRKGDDMTVETNFLEDKEEMYVVFYETKNRMDPNDDLKYGTKTGSGDALKVLATVVEAVKRTAQDLGGMQRVKRILVQSDDDKRFNVYKHYAETLFPGFSVSTIGSWIEITNKNYKPKQ